MTVFDEDSDYDLVDLLCIWCKSHHEAGFNRVEEHCIKSFKDSQEKIFKKLSDSTPNWNNFTEDQKYELSHQPMKEYFKRELDKRNSSVIEVCFRDIYKDAYKESLPACLNDVNSWMKKTGLQGNQTPGYFYARLLVKGSYNKVYSSCFLTGYNRGNQTSSFATLPCPLQFCKYHFNQQVSRTKALHKLIGCMEESWPNLSSSLKLQTLLEKEKVEMKNINQALLDQANEIHRQVKEEECYKGLKFVDKKGQPLDDDNAGIVDFASYDAKFEYEIQNFEKNIKEEFKSDPISPRPKEGTFKLLFDEENVFNLDVQMGFYEPFKPTRFVTEFECRFE